MLLILFVLLIDQISKILIVEFFSMDTQSIFVTNFLELHLVYNKGISFGLLNSLQYSNIIFAVIATLICIYLFYWQKKSHSNIEKKSLSLIIGGAFGNIIDRFHYPGVVDFIALHWKNYYWPSFNIADMAVCCGACILFIINLKTTIRGEKK